MDIQDIKQLAVALRSSLRQHQVRADCIVLFGSHSKRESTPQSDIDIAVISKDFGHDRFLEGSFLNRLAVKIHPDIDAVPIGLKEFLDPAPLSPILHEIKSSGTILL